MLWVGLLLLGDKLLGTCWNCHTFITAYFQESEPCPRAWYLAGARKHPRASLLAQMVQNLPTVRETWAWTLGWEDLREEGTATHSGILAWRIPWTEEPGGLWSVASRRVRHDWTQHNTGSMSWLKERPVQGLTLSYQVSLSAESLISLVQLLPPMSTQTKERKDEILCSRNHFFCVVWWRALEIVLIQSVKLKCELFGRMLLPGAWRTDFDVH